MLFKIKKFVLGNRLLKNSILFNLLYIIYLFIKFLIINKFTFHFPIKMKSIKKSDTLLILGSGSTINQLSTEQAKKLNNYDIAGLSYSIFYSLKINFFFFESPTHKEIDTLEEFKNKIIPRTKLLYKNQSIESLIWKNPENTFFKKFINSMDYKNIIVCHILADSKKTITQIVKIIEYLKLNRYFLLQKRGSLFSIIMFAKLLGYKKVIFSGVDLINNKYFIQDSLYKAYKFKDPNTLDFNELMSKYGNESSNDLHFTNNSSVGLPIIEAIDCLFKEYSNIKFSVTSKDSGLIQYIKLWKV